MLQNKLTLINKVLIFVTTVTVIITVAICFLLLYFPNLHNAALTLSDSEYVQGYTGSVLQLLRDDASYKDMNMSAVDMKNHQLRFQLPEGTTSDDVKMETSYVDRDVTISIDGLDDSYFYNYPMVGNSDNIEDIIYTTGSAKGTIDIMLDDVLEPQLTLEDNYAYLDFVDPHDIYDYVIVVDAGHGGSVPGAIKQGVSEKDIDLKIALYLKKIFAKSDKNIGVYFTRTTDCNPSFASRVGLANDSEADLFISIHNNSTASGRMSAICGTEVMYKAADQSGLSKRLSETLLVFLTQELQSNSKGTVVGDEIYIIKESQVPVALIEVGFMTNKEELEKLCSNSYQKQCAQAIYDACIYWLYDME